jgi:pyruvate dehydrogenase E2 component (dihydrolipoamide acetyltransferase)
VDSLLAIIGPAGTDISGIATNFNRCKIRKNGSSAKPDTTATNSVAQEEATDGKES